MANPEHVAVLKMGIDVWNRWLFKRRLNADFYPDLSKADLSGLDLSRADLRSANLRRANLSRANLAQALLGKQFWRSGSKQTISEEDGKIIVAAGFTSNSTDSWGADLTGANLRDANLARACLYNANLTGADLTRAILTDATFSGKTVWPEGYDPIEHGAVPFSEDFSITFHETLSPEQVGVTLEALADFYRKMGGLGFRVDFELDDVLLMEPVHA